MRLLLAIVLTTLAPAAFASAPAGVWSVPTGVTVSDADTDTPTVIITGLFTVHTGEGGTGGDWGFSGFEAATEGYMHYVCKAGDKDMCLLQWDDIAKAAQDKSCVGWGQNDGSNGSVHATGTPTGYPDEWDLGVGVVSGYTPCQYLAAYVPPTGGDVGSDAGGADVANPGPDDATPDVPDVAVDTGPGGGDATGDAADVPVSIDTGTTDPGPDTGAADTGMTGGTGGTKDDDDSGCAGAPVSALGLLVLVLARKRTRRA